MMNDFNIGDIVRLNSGSPAMTVNAIRIHAEYTVVYCVWFVDGVLMKGDFDSLSLFDARVEE